MRPPRRPSPRAYRRLVVGHMRAYARWASGVVEAAAKRRDRPRADEDGDDGDVDAETDLNEWLIAANDAYWLRRALQQDQHKAPANGGPPVRPTPQDFTEVVKPAARFALTESRAGLVRAGAYRPALDARLGLTGPTREGGIPLIDIAPTPYEARRIREFAARGVELIKRLEQRHLTGLDELIAEAVREGKRYTQLRDMIAERTGASERHAELIARDQIGKVNARITEDVQAQAGVESYIWRTANDQRVRGNPAGPYAKSTQDHWGLRDTEQRWDDPPKGAGPYNQPAHPGESVSCRCYADPVLPEDLRRPEEPPTTRMRRMGPRGGPQDPDAPFVDVTARRFRDERGNPR